MDSNIHKELTERTTTILTNIERLQTCASTRNADRAYAFDSEINDSKENLLKTAEFVGQLSGNVELNLLPYHNLGAQKCAFIEGLSLIELEPLKMLNWTGCGSF